LQAAASRRGRAVGPGKKTAEAIGQEVAREIDQLLCVVFSGRRKAGHLDLEAVETAVRAAMHRAGSAALTELLQFAAPASDQRQLPCSCGHHAQYREQRSKPVLTVVGQDAPFDHGREQMKVLAGLEVTTKSVERTAEAIGEDIAQREREEMQKAIQLDLPVVAGKPIPVLYVEMDGTGVPVVKKETLGHQGKTEGQPAHTREVKLGCVFTQTKCDKEGFPIRDPDSTTYTGAIETAEEFGKRIYLEAWQRGWSRAANKVVLGDGAEWIWNLADQHFPGAMQIVDLYHARQHLWELARKLYPNDTAKQKAWMKKHQRRLLDKGKIEKLVLTLRAIDATNPEVIEKIRIEANYFERNAERMRYPRFRRQHLFVGSGVIEAGCKTVVGSRLKQSGMFWTVRGANAIVALRCCHLNGNFEDYWEDRRAA
jgi:hypothetical protein